MLGRTHGIVVATAILGVLTTGCRDVPASAEPSDRPPPRSAPTLSDNDEALLASLLADDPSDFHGARARIWRIGAARWITDGPELPKRPSDGLHDAALDRAIEVVVVDDAGPRVLLPLGDLDRGLRAPRWPALRLVAVLNPSDLVAGLARELRPTPWLTLAAGVGLTPLEHKDDHLRVRWSDAACGFGLELAIDTGDFSPVYEPGPSGRPVDEPEPNGGPTLRLSAGTQIYADPDAEQAIVKLDAAAASEGERLSAALRVSLIGEPTRKLQQISLRCRGVAIEGYVKRESVVEIPGRYAIVEAEPPPSSSCEGFDAEPILVPRATALYEPGPNSSSIGPSLIGVAAEDVELSAMPGSDGWWKSCVPSPWGDLLFEFRLR